MARVPTGVSKSRPLFVALSWLSRCDKLTREVHEKEESLAKARVDLTAELQASGGSSIGQEQSLPPDNLTGARGHSSGTAPSLDLSGDDSSAKGTGGVRLDGPWVLESLGLQQVSAMEVSYCVLVGF